MEKKLLRILVIDDSPDDAELPVGILRQAGYRVKSQRIYNVAGMEAAFAKGSWDLVLSEFTLLQFGAKMALDFLKRRHKEIPFIVLTRTINDSDLSKIMKAGARDVIKKNDAARLVPAIDRELAIIEERKKYIETAQTVKEMESKHQAMVDSAREAVCYCHEGIHLEVNQAYLNLFGYDNLEELEVIPVLNLITKSDHKKFKDALRKAAKKKKLDQPIGLQAVKKDGSNLYIEAALQLVALNGENCIQITVNDISKRKATEDRLHYLTQHDTLTGLYNRHFFTKLLGQALENAKTGGSNSVLIYVGLDQLKEINNAHGYTAGDRMLLKVTKLFCERLGENAVLARFGDDELTILLEGKSENEGKEIVAALKGALKESPFHIEDKTYHCDCTTSVTVVDSNLRSVHEIFTNAYKASNKVRPTPTIVQIEPPVAVTAPPAQPTTISDSPEIAPLREANISSITTSAEQQHILDALTNNNFTLLYQPIVNMNGGVDEYYEVLVRMIGENDQLILPGDFIPDAEKAGLMATIDKWVLQRSIESLATLHQDHRPASYFVNLSPQALEGEELIPFIRDTLDSAGVKPQHLVLELPHSVMTDNIEKVSKFIATAHELGCIVSLDNSDLVIDSLLKLPRQSIGFLKFDGNLIRNTGKTGDKNTLSAVLEMVKQLAIKTVATHIEDAASLAEIWTYGFDYVQGHYFQQPDTETSYEFVTEDETTLSSDKEIAPTWTARQ